jgi:hypothetical protein
MVEISFFSVFFIKKKGECGGAREEGAPRRSGAPQAKGSRGASVGERGSLDLTGELIARVWEVSARFRAGTARHWEERAGSSCHKNNVTGTLSRFSGREVPRFWGFPVILTCLDTNLSENRGKRKTEKEPKCIQLLCDFY